MNGTLKTKALWRKRTEELLEEGGVPFSTLSAVQAPLEMTDLTDTVACVAAVCTG